MHSDLSPHLHTDTCNAIIAQLKACHQQYPWLKFTGQCNAIDREMRVCLKGEYEANRWKNRQHAQERQRRQASRP
ncbi:COX assembly mitochondrial protein 2 homolog [Lampetra fluviatilis]